MNCEKQTKGRVAGNTFLVCIDDTDMPGTKGTGWLVQALCEELGQKYSAQTSAISRHQLYVHEDIPYTSHNSSMCFELVLKESDPNPVIAFMSHYLETRCQKGSDPGLCVAAMDDSLDRSALIEFGRNAKKAVSSKKAAYDLARKAGIHLSEHGGTGQGVVGAIAGVGLWLYGNDGRYRGWFHLGEPGEVVSVAHLCQYPFIDEVVTPIGETLPDQTLMQIGADRTKTVRIHARQVVVAQPVTNGSTTFRTITKQEAKQY